MPIKKKPKNRKLSTKRRYRKQVNPAESHSEVLVGAGVGLAGYAATRVTGRLAFLIAEHKAPRFSRHAHVVGSVVSALLIYFLTRSIKRTQPYHKAAAIGAAIAAIHALGSALFPAFSWILETPARADYQALPSTQQSALRAPATAPPALPASQPADVQVIKDEIIPETASEEQPDDFLEMNETIDNVYEFPVRSDIG